MPTKTRTFNGVKFSVTTYREAFGHINSVFRDIYREYVVPVNEALARDGDGDLDAARRVPDTVTKYTDTFVQRDATNWKFDTAEELFADMQREPYQWARFRLEPDFMFPIDGLYVWVNAWTSYVTVEVKARSVPEVERIMAFFEDQVKSSLIPVPPAPAAAPDVPHIFIGHGGTSSEWRSLYFELQSKHGFDCEAFESGARSGHSVRDVLDAVLARSTFALLVFTKEDEQADGDFRARQNVVHEAGLFQGRLGFPRAIILREKGVSLFSNVDGVQYIEFETGKITATVGDIIATIRREFPN